MKVKRLPIYETLEMIDDNSRIIIKEKLMAKFGIIPKWEN